MSTDKQVDHGVSLEAQRTTLDADAALYDIELVAVMVDAGVSAKTLQRPGVPQALGMLKTGEADARRVAQLDRLTRRVKALGTRLDAYFADACTLRSVADSLDTRTAAGRLGRNVLMSVAQWERETIRERTTEAMHHRNTQGRKTGGDRPYGCTRAADGTTLMADSDAQAMRKAIRSARPARPVAACGRGGAHPARLHHAKGDAALRHAGTAHHVTSMYGCKGEGMPACCACGAPAAHHHHVVPRVLGGTQTVPLCTVCHGKVHDTRCGQQRALTRRGVVHTKAYGHKTGSDVPDGFTLAADGTPLLPAGEERNWCRRYTRCAREGSRSVPS